MTMKVTVDTDVLSYSASATNVQMVTPCLGFWNQKQTERGTTACGAWTEDATMADLFSLFFLDETFPYHRHEGVVRVYDTRGPNWEIHIDLYNKDLAPERISKYIRENTNFHQLQIQWLALLRTKQKLFVDAIVYHEEDGNLQCPPMPKCSSRVIVVTDPLAVCNSQEDKDV